MQAKLACDECDSTTEYFGRTNPFEPAPRVLIATSESAFWSKLSGRTHSPNPANQPAMTVATALVQGSEPQPTLTEQPTKQTVGLQFASAQRPNRHCNGLQTDLLVHQPRSLLLRWQRQRFQTPVRALPRPAPWSAPTEPSNCGFRRSNLLLQNSAGSAFVSSIYKEAHVQSIT